MPKQKTKIPEGWREVRLSEIIKFQGGFAFKTEDYKDSGVPLVRIGNVGKGYFDAADFVYLSKELFDEQKQFQLQAGDVLMGMTGDLGKVCKIKEQNLPALLNQRVGKIVIKNKNVVNGDFIYQVFLSADLHAKFEKHFEGMAQKNISPSQVESVEILLPPLSTQNTIAEILGAVDGEIEKIEGIIKGDEKAKSGVAKEIFTRVGKQIKIGDICEVRGGKRLPAGEVLLGDKTGHPYIRIVDFKDGGVDQSNIKYLSESIFEKIKRYTISKDDIYISIAGTIGMVGLIPDVLDGSNLTENAAKLVIRDKQMIDKFFIYHLLNSSFGQTQIRGLTVKTTQPKLALNKIESVKLILPPAAEQEKIVDILSAVDGKILIYKKIKDNLIQLKKGLMADLLSGAVSYYESK